MIVSVVMLAFWQWSVTDSAHKARQYLETLRSVMPEPESATLEPRRDNTMSVHSVDGVDFSGILEMPRYGSSLPVCADWGDSSKYPSVLSGSIYDGSLMVGCTTGSGQYDFYREISDTRPIPEPDESIPVYIPEV